MKSKFIVENQTGAPLEIKQRGTPDLEDGSRQEDRCARMLLHEQRHAGPSSSSINKHFYFLFWSPFLQVLVYFAGAPAPVAPGSGWEERLLCWKPGLLEWMHAACMAMLQMWLATS